MRSIVLLTAATAALANATRSARTIR
jgi:hypothetical protein